MRRSWKPEIWNLLFLDTHAANIYSNANKRLFVNCGTVSRPSYSTAAIRHIQLISSPGDWGVNTGPPVMRRFQVHDHFQTFAIPTDIGTIFELPLDKCARNHASAFYSNFLQFEKGFTFSFVRRIQRTVRPSSSASLYSAHRLLEKSFKRHSSANEIPGVFVDAECTDFTSVCAYVYDVMR